jgi:hypothetical protein
MGEFLGQVGGKEKYVEVATKYRRIPHWAKNLFDRNLERESPNIGKLVVSFLYDNESRERAVTCLAEILGVAELRVEDDLSSYEQTLLAGARVQAEDMIQSLLVFCNISEVGPKLLEKLKELILLLPSEAVKVNGEVGDATLYGIVEVDTENYRSSIINAVVVGITGDLAVGREGLEIVPDQSSLATVAHESFHAMKVLISGLPSYYELGQFGEGLANLVEFIALNKFSAKAIEGINQGLIVNESLPIPADQLNTALLLSGIRSLNNLEASLGIIELCKFIPIQEVIGFYLKSRDREELRELLVEAGVPIESVPNTLK